MPDDSWSADGSQVPVISPHTETKHNILKDYLTDWVFTLCGNSPGMKKKITIIDGFAGGGVYLKKGQQETRVPGSPILMIQAIEEGLQRVKLEKSKPEFELDWELKLVESDYDHLQCLQSSFREFGYDHYLDSGFVEFIHGEFSEKFDYCHDVVKTRKGSSFFFIDPFGYTQFSTFQLQQIMKIPNSEILLTFMIQFIERFLVNENSRQGFERTMNAEAYFLEAKADDLFRPEKQKYLRNETLRLLRTETGVKFLYAFSLLQTHSRAIYYLIHFANHQTAQQVVKTSLWKYNTADEFYGYSYDVHGLAHLPSKDAGQDTLFEIKNRNQGSCQENLFDQLMPVIETSARGISFLQLENYTMQENPADRNLYRSTLSQMVSNGDIEIFRENRRTRSKDIKGTDIIRRNTQMRIVFEPHPNNPFRKE